MNAQKPPRAKSRSNGRRRAPALAEANRALREGEVPLPLAAEGVGLGLWDWDLVRDEAFLSPRYYEMTGYREGERKPDLAFFQSIIHPDDLPEVMRTMTEHLRGGSEYSNIEYRMRRKSGEYVWINGIGRVVERGADGSPLRMVGAIADLSRREGSEAQTHAFNAALEARVFARTVALERANALLATLGGVAARLPASHDTDRILETLGAEVRELGLNCLVALFETDGQAVVVRYVSATASVLERAAELTGSLRVGLRVTPANPLVWKKLIAQQSVVWNTDVKPLAASLLPGAPVSVVNKALGLVGLTLAPNIGLPLVFAGRRVGFLLLWGKSLSEEIAPIFTTLAAQVAAMLAVAEKQSLIRQSEAKYRALVEQVPAVIYISALNKSGGALYVSPQIETLLGFTPEECLADPQLWSKRLHPDDSARVLAELARVRASGDFFQSEYRMVARDGRTVWVLDEGRIARDETGKPLFMRGVTRDITERKQIETAEREHRFLAETLRGVSAALASTLDPGQVSEKILEALLRLVKCDAANIMLIEGNSARIARRRALDPAKQSAFDGVTFDLSQTDHLRRCAESRAPVVVADTNADSLWARPAGTEWLRACLTAPIVTGDSVAGFINLESAAPNFFTAAHAMLLETLAQPTALALANARRYAEAIRNAEVMRLLARRLTRVQEDERARLARELHDEIGQALASQLVDLHFIEEKIQRPDAVAVRVKEMKKRTNDMFERLHRLATDLRPPNLDHLGLVAALRQHVQDFAALYRVDADFQAVGFIGESLRPETEIELYRIAQEALTNVARHARAQRAQVLLQRNAESLILTIWDDGVGFNPEAGGRADRLGLAGIRERAAMLGGKATIESAPGAGATIRVEAPYDD